MSKPQVSKRVTIYEPSRTSRTMIDEPTPPNLPNLPNPPRPPLRNWRADEQELWIDMLGQFSELLIADTLARTHRAPDPETIIGNTTRQRPNPPMPDPDARAHLRDDIQLAAELADGVLEEIQYREWINRPPRPRPRPRARARPKPRKAAPR